VIGLDSNVLLRAVLNDDDRWSALAEAFVETQCTPERPGYINNMVLAEICCVLRRRPDFDRQSLADFVHGLLEADNLVIAEHESVAKALSQFRRGRAGFADYLIAEINARAGAAPTYTIDRDAARSDAFEVISPERA
jgi:predicted nucleic-acid-binding protein